MGSQGEMGITGQQLESGEHFSQEETNLEDEEEEEEEDLRRVLVN